MSMGYTHSVENHRYRDLILRNARDMAARAGSCRILLFLETPGNLEWYRSLPADSSLIPVVPGSMDAAGPSITPEQPRIVSWSGNQSRFSRIKYAFLKGVSEGVLRADEVLVCALGPAGRSHLDTVTLHDLGLSWGEEFPFDVQPLISTGFLPTIMAVTDIALDIGALGREGKAVGTIFVIGDTVAVMEQSHQAVFNPFHGYDRSERAIERPMVVESLKELARLDGAIIISHDGIAEAAGRHLDARSTSLAHYPGLGARHRAAAGISDATGAVALVVSESTGRLSVFQGGRSIATLEPLIGRRVV